MIEFFIKSILMSILPFYRVNFPVEIFPKNFIYIEYSHGKEVAKTEININDESYINLKELVTKQTKDWRYDLTTYAPNHTFNSKGIKINCLNTTLVVNYEYSNGNWIQISKQILNGSCPVVTLKDTE